MGSDTVMVSHGKLVLQVPRSIFLEDSSELDREKADEYGRLLQSRYPWLSSGSLETLFRAASREMERTLESELRAKGLKEPRKTDDESEISRLQAYLKIHPRDADAWYELGNLLCKAGRSKEGYEAFNRGRSCF